MEPLTTVPPDRLAKLPEVLESHHGLQRTEIGSAFGLPWICLVLCLCSAWLDWKLSGALMPACGVTSPIGHVLLYRLRGTNNDSGEGCQTVGSIWWNCGIGPIASLADSNGAHLMSSALHKADNVPPAFRSGCRIGNATGSFVLAATWLLECLGE